MATTKTKTKVKDVDKGGRSNARVARRTGPGPIFVVLIYDGEPTEYGFDIQTAEALAYDLQRQCDAARLKARQGAAWARAYAKHGEQQRKKDEHLEQQRKKDTVPDYPGPDER